VRYSADLFALKRRSRSNVAQNDGNRDRGQRAARDVSDARRRGKRKGSEADAVGVGAWLTEGQTHVVKIASHRAPDK
jgi:hypothetical protein